MTSLRISRLALPAFAALAVSLPAAAQQPQQPQSYADSLPVVVDSTTPQHNWVVNVLRKVTLRSDGPSATDSSAAAVAAAATARRAAYTFDSKADRREYESARAVAERAKGYRIVVDIEEHQLYVIDGSDTLRNAPVATASGNTLKFGGKTWRFETPRGVRRVLSKDKEPSWTPPEWHYAEVALENHLKLRTMHRGEVIRLQDGTKLLTRGDEVGVIYPGTKEFIPMVLDEHVVFDNTLFIPPAGTKQRSFKGELGHFRLALGDGYLLHGTPYANSIGSSVTHGCVRLQDDDIEWLYDNVPVGTRVYIY